MSNLNKAFIQAYTKENRAKSLASDGQRPTEISAHMRNATMSQLENLTFYRIDAGNSEVIQSIASEPWYVSLSNASAQPAHATMAARSTTVSESIESHGTSTGSRLSTKTLNPMSTRGTPTTHNKSNSQDSVEYFRVDLRGKPGPHFDVASAVSSSTKTSSTHAETLPKSEAEEKNIQPGMAIGIAGGTWPVESPSSQSQSAPVAPSPEKSVEAQKAPAFRAVWEVDSIAWPDVANMLCDGENSILAEVGLHLKQANVSGLRTLLVTSLIPGVGRTTVTMCIARCAARAGLKVAMIDGDLCNPKLTEQLNIEAAHGWNEHVCGFIPLEEAAIYSIQDKVTLLPLALSTIDSEATRPSSIRPDHPAVHQMLSRLAQSFDLVVIDAQHLAYPSGKVIGSHADGLIDAAVIVTDSDLTDRPELLVAMSKLERLGVRSTGIVENFQIDNLQLKSA